MNAPLISIIIPVKNRIEELKRAINSVLNQTNQNFEILVIDDHSSENIREAVDLYNDDRISYHKSTKEPSNANVCRNIGVDNAKGEYIAMLDSDDEWMPNHVQKSIDYLLANNCDGVFGSIVIDNGISKSTAYSLPLLENQKMVNYILSGGNVSTCTHLYSAKSAQSIKWDENLYRHQDYDFAVRYSKVYNFQPIVEPSVIVHWKKGEKRDEHFNSLIRFIEINKGEITPRNYINYHKNKFNDIKERKDISRDIINHYQKETLKFINMISLNEYLMLFGQNKGALQRVLLRLEYLFKVLLKNQ